MSVQGQNFFARGELQGVAENSNIKMPFCENPFDEFPAQFFTLFNAGVSHTAPGQKMLLFSQPPWFLTSRHPWEHEVSKKCKWQTYAPVNNKEPSPPLHSSYS